MARSKVGDVAAEASSSAVDRAASAAAAVSSKSSSALTTTGAHLKSAEETLSRRVRARLPEPVRLALVVVLSSSFNALGQSFLHFWTNGELENIARRPGTNGEIALLSAWRMFGLALGWFCEYDGYDLAALALLSSGPATYLTSAFYGVRALTAGAYLGLDVLSAFLPFLLLRQPSDAHSAAPGVPNREIVTDRGIQILTSLLSGLVYSVVLFLASRTYLPGALVLYFNGIPTIRPAVDAVLLGFGSPTTQVLSLLFGLAARTFIFTPLVTTPRTAQEDQEIEDFDPVGATLGETVAFNLWGFTSQTKVSIKRTAIVMLFTAVSTYMQCALGIEGVESYGAVVYASVFVIAAAVTGLSLRYVGSVPA